MQQIQHCPYSPEPNRYGAGSQSPLPSNNTKKLTDSEIKQVQKFVRSTLYYARVVNMTVLMALSTNASKQTKGTKCTLEKAYQVLNYLVMHHDAMVRFHASNTVVNIHSDALYLSKPNAPSRACFHFLWDPYQSMGNPSNLTGLPYTVFNFTICGGISCQSQTWSIIPQLPRGDDFQTHPQGLWPSITKNTSPLQQCNSRWHCKQHHQTATISGHGNEIFLDM
jgi:hypothetical protein